VLITKDGKTIVVSYIVFVAVQVAIAIGYDSWSLRYAGQAKHHTNHAAAVNNITLDF
jgi:hypothetical protein